MWEHQGNQQSGNLFKSSLSVDKNGTDFWNIELLFRSLRSWTQCISVTWNVKNINASFLKCYYTKKNKNKCYCCSKELQNNALGGWKSEALWSYSENTLNTLFSFQQMNDSSMIISALASYLHDRDQGLSEIVKCYPSISFTDDDGKLKNEILNRYFLMYQGNVPQGKTKEAIL